MLHPKQLFYLDVNHAPCFQPFDSLPIGLRLRSGDGTSLELLKTLNQSFSSAFGYAESFFCDFSPASLSFFMHQAIPEKEIVALSSKLPYHLYHAGQLLEKYGRQIIWIDADTEGGLCEKSLALAKEHGARYLVCSAVDEDTFYIEDMKKISRYFDMNHLLLDLSNALKLENIPKAFSAFIWGYKVGSFKHSGVFMCSKCNSSDMIPSIDLTVYDHFYHAYIKFSHEKYGNIGVIRDQFLKQIVDALGNKVKILINPQLILPNSCYISFDGVYARDMIRTMALEGIYLTNGELCSLGLSQPSRIVKAIGYSDEEVRVAISFSFGNLTCEDVENIGGKVIYKYRQLHAILVD